MVKIPKIILIVSLFLLSVSCTKKVSKVEYFILLNYYNYSEPMKIPFNADSLFHIINCDTFDVSFLKYNTQLELNDVEKSFFFSEYAFAMDKYNYFKAESYISNIFTKKLEVILPIGQFISSNNKDVKTLVVLFERIINDTTSLKNVVFFNVKIFEI